MKPLRVLIVEDEALIALLFAEVLEELGHEVCATERTEAGAIAAAARCQPGLIIADVGLQEGSGIDAVNAIMQAGFVPHVFVSGSGLERERLNPAAGTLQKPFSETQLVAAITRAVDPENVAIGERHIEELRHA
ncbi:MAG: response regulator [Beijerinckiaceae bacterium]